MRHLAAAVGILVVVTGLASAEQLRGADEVGSASQTAPALPIQPLSDAEEGEWARYRIDDAATGAYADTPAQVYTVTKVDASAGIEVAGTQIGESYLFRAKADLTANEYVRCFLKASGAKTWGSELEVLRIQPETVKLRGTTYQTHRIDARIEDRLAPSETGASSNVSVSISVWLSPEVRALGVVKASVVTTMGGLVTGGSLVLTDQGSAGERLADIDTPLWLPETPATPSAAK